MKKLPTKIGRFAVRRILGTGAQSVVYLAFDPSLEREVALKTLHFANPQHRGAQAQALAQESRAVSPLRHPNVVPIFEAGEHEGDPYLVFEYVEGQTLADLLRGRGALPAGEAVGLLIPVLEALAHAHRNGVIHRDLKPSNILLSREGVPRVMDFGIAARIDRPDKNEILAGTPAYMAPEYIESRTVSEKIDIFVAGLILYEMVVGRKAVQPGDAHQMMRHIATEDIRLPAGDSALDERLGDILLKALARNPLNRYARVQDLRDALVAYQRADTGALTAGTGASQSTLDFLLRRMRHKSDFPALSESVGAINRIVSSDQESINKLSNSILKDFALTNKILKLVNTAFYSQYGGGTISTISRAVIILGFDAVRNIAITLILFEHLQNKSHAAQIKEEFTRALFSAILAKDIAAKGAARDPEEAFICAMFHNLGRLLARFYFPEEVEAVKKVMAQTDCTEETASIQVLGISYQDLGIGVAQSWGFPEQIVRSMHKLPKDAVPRPVNATDRLRLIAGLADDLCEMISGAAAAQRQTALKKIAARFGPHLPVLAKDLGPILERSLAEIAQYASAMRIGLAQSPFGRQVAAWTESLAGAGDRTLTRTTGPARDAQVLSAAQELAPAQVEMPTSRSIRPDPGDRQAMLAAGIQDISNSLVSDQCSLNDLLRMILETMYRGMGFQRVLLCVKDARQNAMVGRFGFGQDVAQLTGTFKFPLSYAPDVFHAALSKGVDILISDINDPKIKGRIPDWHRKTVTAQTFVLFPLKIKDNPIALIYADRERAGDILLPETELGLLRTLRNQAVLAVKQST